MAGNKCVYLMCGKNSRHHRISLFGFPKDLERSRKWIIHSGNTDLIHLEIEDLRKKKICSDHFVTDDYLNLSKRILKRTAVPICYEPVIQFHVRSPKKKYNSKFGKCNNLDLSSTSNDLSTLLTPSKSSNYNPRCLNFESPKSIHLSTPIKTYTSIESNDNTPIITPKTQLWLDDTLQMPESSSVFKEQVQSLNDIIKTQEKDIKKLKKKLELNQKLLSNKRSTTSKLKKNLQNARHLFKNKNIFNSINFPSTDSQILVKMQIRQSISRKPWTKLEQDLSLRLYYTSPSAYKFLRRTKINLPGLATIKRWIGVSKFKPGQTGPGTSKKAKCSFCPKKENRYTVVSCATCSSPICKKHTTTICDTCICKTQIQEENI